MLAAPAETSAARADRRAPGRRPALFDRPTWGPESPAGRLFSPAASEAGEAALLRACWKLASERLGPFSRAVELLPAREQERALLLLSLADVLFATAAGPGSLDSRVDDLDRIAFSIARALRGESPGELFAQRFAAESRRRGFTRQALDDLFEAARHTARQRRPETPEALAQASHRIADAFATALFGTEPTVAVVDLGAGLLRLHTLQALAADLRAQHCGLPESELAEPVQYRTGEEIGVAVERECAHLRQLLLKGARAAGEVPLSFRRPVAFLLPVALSLLGVLEDRPAELARRAPTVGTWTLRRAYWQARFTSLT
jgi:phytoene/squalene synthetase